jgi:hypothetical protein
MEDKIDIIEPLLERAKAYGKTSYDLFKLNALDKGSGILSSFFSQAVVVFFLFMFIAMLSIGAAIWLGEIIGKWYYGFFCIAGFYLLAASIVFFLLRTSIKKSVRNSIISQMLN